MPRTLPIAAPISRFRLIRRSRHSKITMACREGPESRIEVPRKVEGLNLETSECNENNK